MHARFSNRRASCAADTSFAGSQYASGLVRKSLRKPRPGMFHEAVAEFRIDVSQSIMVGDKSLDLMAGAVAGIQKVFLLDSEKYPDEMNTWKQWPLRSRFETKESMTLQGSWDQLSKKF